MEKEKRAQSCSFPQQDYCTEAIFSHGVSVSHL